MAYTAGTLATFMATTLGATGAALGLTDVSAAIVEAVNEVAAVLGVAVDTVDDDLKLRTIARWQAWLAAEASAANDFNMKAGAASLEMADRFDHIETMVARAELSAKRYPEVAAILAASDAVYVTLGGSGDPYATTSEGW